MFERKKNIPVPCTYERILDVKPGLTSTASLYDYTHGELFEDEESVIHVS